MFLQVFLVNLFITSSCNLEKLVIQYRVSKNMWLQKHWFFVIAQGGLK